MVGAGVGAMEANTWCTRSHTDTGGGWWGGRGPGMAMGGEGGEAVGPGRSFWRWWGGGGASLLQRMEGIS